MRTPSLIIALVKVGFLPNPTFSPVHRVPPNSPSPVCLEATPLTPLSSQSQDKYENMTVQTFSEQNDLGWDKFFQGWVVLAWGEAFQQNFHQWNEHSGKAVWSSRSA
jgi:hypothetical protein